MVELHVHNQTQALLSYVERCIEYNGRLMSKNSGPIRKLIVKHDIYVLII